MLNILKTLKMLEKIKNIKKLSKNAKLKKIIIMILKYFKRIYYNTTSIAYLVLESKAKMHRNPGPSYYSFYMA